MEINETVQIVTAMNSIDSNEFCHGPRIYKKKIMARRRRCCCLVVVCLIHQVAILSRPQNARKGINPNAILISLPSSVYFPFPSYFKLSHLHLRCSFPAPQLSLSPFIPPQLT
jgi:hypothetical protein